MCSVGWPLSSTSQTRPRLTSRSRGTDRARNSRKGSVLEPERLIAKGRDPLTTAKPQPVGLSHRRVHTCGCRLPVDEFPVGRRLRPVGLWRGSRFVSAWPTVRRDASRQYREAKASPNNPSSHEEERTRDSPSLAHSEERRNGFWRCARRPCQQHTHLQQVAAVNWLTGEDE